MANAIELTKVIEPARRNLNLKNLGARAILICAATWGLFTGSLILWDWIKREYDLLRTNLALAVMAEYLDGKQFEIDEKKRSFITGDSNSTEELKKALFVLSRQYEMCEGTLATVNDISSSILVQKSLKE